MNKPLYAKLDDLYDRQFYNDSFKMNVFGTFKQ